MSCTTCVNPNCCEETNPNCCEICNCLNFTSSNNTLDIGKTGCKVDIRITNNILDGLMSIPSSSCITIVKEYVNGQLVFTPTLNLQCVENLIPTIPTIPTVPTYTATNGVKLTDTNFEFGTTPLLHNTDFILGTPTNPFNLHIYQNDPSNSKPVYEQFIGTVSNSVENKIDIKSGITGSDKQTTILQKNDSFSASVQTVQNIETDISYFTKGYFNIGNDSNVFGYKYPISLNTTTNPVQSIDGEHTAYCKAYDANFEIGAKNVFISAISNINATLELGVPNAYFVLSSVNQNPQGLLTVYPIDTANQPCTIINYNAGSTLIESDMYNERNSGAYYAKGQLFTSGNYSLLGTHVPNTTSTEESAPSIDAEKTTFFKTAEGVSEIFGKTIMLHNESSTHSIIQQSMIGASSVLESINGSGKWLSYVFPTDTVNFNSSLLYVVPGLVDFETFFDSERATGAFYASSIISSDSRTATDPNSRIGVYCPNSTDTTVYPQPPVDINRTSATVYTKATVSTIAKEIVNNGKTLITDVTTTPYGTGSTLPCAAFEVRSSTGGTLLPRMTSTERLAISAPVAGLQVFDVTFGAVLTFDGTLWTGFRYNSGNLKFEGYNGSTWIALN